MRVHFPYAWLAVALAVVIAFGSLIAFHVRSALWLGFGTALLWIPISVLLNAYLARFRPPALKEWTARRRTFFELL